MNQSYFAEIARGQEAHVWNISDTDFPASLPKQAPGCGWWRRFAPWCPEPYELNRHLFGPRPPQAIPLLWTSSRLEELPLSC